MFPPHGGGGWMVLRGRREELEKGRKLAPGTIPRALRLAARYRPAIAGFLATGIAGAFLAIVPPLLVRALIDRAILPGRMNIVGWLALAGVGVAVAQAGMALLGRYLSARVGEGLIFDLRVGLFDHVQRLPLAFFTRTQTGALISRLNNDVIGAQSAVTQTLSTIVTTVITLGATLAAMITLSWQITLLAMIVLPVFLLPSKRVGRRLQSLTREQMGLNASMNSQMQERFNVSGAMLAKLFGKPERERAGFSSKAGDVRDMGVKIAVYARTFFITMGLVSAVGAAVVYWLGGRFAIQGSMSPGTVVALVQYVGQLYMPLMAITNARVDLMTSFVSFERVFEVLDLPPAIRDKPDAVPLRDARGRVEFREVWMRYPRAQEVSLASLETVGSFDDEQPSGDVLRAVSFTVEPGRTVALVGPSGAGKTTIANLIPRLFDVTEGAVLVDGHDVRDLELDGLRAAVGVVTQDPHLFHDTIRNNLRYARPDADEDEIAGACRAAQIHDLIASLPDGYETVVGERGYRLSGGEKQRLAIARVLLKRPAIVILDEATSHLDSESEVLIQRALASALADRTSIVIAHRLSTILDADEILVVEDGKIVQRGSHDGLATEPGTYLDLYTTQFARRMT